MEGKLIIFAAPSGCGKSTIINYLMDELKEDYNLQFSVSVTTRAPRPGEVHGQHYYFLPYEEAKQRIANNEFVEYEEVYEGTIYGTLREQVDKRLADGVNVVFDVDVNGAMRIKEAYGKRALSIFIQPPTIETLRQRLISRGTDAMDVIERRVARASYEISCADKFDEVIVNDVLEVAQVEAQALLEDFLDDQE